METPRAGRLLREVRDATRGVEAKSIDLDVSAVSKATGTVAALLVELRAELSARGAQVRIIGANERVRALVALYSGEKPLEAPARPGSVAALGRAADLALAHGRATVEFTGELASTLPRVLRRPRLAHLRELPKLLERAGPDALPIVLVINFLVGFVMAYQFAEQLRIYGANVYVADLVGISSTREIAPLVTAIVICGRSGAAFAAEIATMKVSDEIDALRTLALPPTAWLVVPRVLALVLVVPVLTVLADLVSVAGGAVVAVASLDLTIKAYFNELEVAVFGWDVITGLIKSVFFAVAIAVIGCQQGFAAESGPESVGSRTTSTVVATLFALVVLDSLITAAFRRWGI